jgi:hypothetical protein
MLGTGHPFDKSTSINCWDHGMCGCQRMHIQYYSDTELHYVILYPTPQKLEHNTKICSTLLVE